MSIIHHYQQEPAYPLVHAGFAPWSNCEEVGLSETMPKNNAAMHVSKLDKQDGPVIKLTADELGLPHKIP